MQQLFFILLAICALFFTQLSSASERLKQVIMNSPSDYYVLQLASVSEATDLTTVVNNIGIKTQLVAVKTTVNKKSRWAILQGIYINAEQAKVAADKLKSEKPDLNPWPRTIGSLKQVLTVTALTKD